MKFLEKLDFSKDEIAELVDNSPEAIIEALKNQKALVSENISFLKELGIENYKEIFLGYNDMFLMDSSNFKEIFNKYETDDLISKLSKNINIVEFL